MTTVEWLLEQMQTKPFTQQNATEILNQAKEMEKQQRGYSEEDLKAAYNAESEGWSGFDFWFEQFKNK